MNGIQFNEIKSRLADWREERHLTYENQKKGFLGNVFEEVSEYFRAKDDYERIDAICDIAVFFFNAYDFKYRAVFSRMDYYTFSDVVVYNIYSLFGVRTDELCVVENENALLYLENHLNLTMFEIEQLCKNLGFDFFKCMIETIKEIESRTGYYDDKIGKFVKDLGAYHYDEALEKASKDFEFLNNATSCCLLKENENFWHIACEDKYKGIYKEYIIKKWYKANYENCRIRG